MAITSVVVPAYNEEKAIGKVIEEILGQDVDEIIVVDDGSTDNTYKIAYDYSRRYKKVKVFRHDHNRGKVDAIRTGIKHSQGDIVILIDADFTYPASAFSRMILEMEKGSDLVLGSRFKDGVENMSFINRVGNLLFSSLVAYITGIDVTDCQTGLRAFRRDNFGNLDVDAKGLEYETKMTMKSAKLGYRITEIPIRYRRRIGESKLNPFLDGYRMFLSIFHITISETSPLSKTIMFPSVLLFFVGSVFGLISIYEFITYNDVLHPYYPLITVLFTIVGIQLFSISLLIDNMTKKIELIMRKLK